MGSKNTVIHIHSTAVENGGPKLPSADLLAEGEIGINYADGYETITFKNKSNEIVQVKTTKYYEEKEKEIKDSISALEASISDSACTYGGHYLPSTGNGYVNTIVTGSSVITGFQTDKNGHVLSGWTTTNLPTSIGSSYSASFGLGSTGYTTGAHLCHIFTGFTFYENSSFNPNANAIAANPILTLYGASGYVTTGFQVSGGTFLGVTGTPKGATNKIIPLLTFEVKTGTSSTTVARGDHNHSGVYAAASHTHTASALPTATTSAYGITQLSTSYTSTSTALAATPSAVKAVHDIVLANEETTAASLTDLNSKFSNYSLTSHTHTNYSLTSHTHTGTYAPYSHSQGDTTITWSQANIQGSISPIDGAFSNVHSANRLALANPDGITIEYSTDGGSTWVDYGASDAAKINLVSNIGTSFVVGKGTYNGSNSLLRITLNATAMGVYTSPRKLLINISTGYMTGCTVGVEWATKGDLTSFTSQGTYDISGCSGWNSIPLTKLSTFGGSAAQTTNGGAIRLTFGGDFYDSSKTVGLTVLDLYMIGLTYWTTPSTLAKTGCLFSHDYLGNATFPANVKASTFNGYTIAASVPSGAKFTDTDTKVTSVSNHYTPASSSTVGAASGNNYIRGINIDAAGHIVSISTGTPTNTTYAAATTSAAGLMSAADKSKLDGISANANAYSLPTASTSTLGGIKVGSYLSISSGVLSVNAGTASTQVALGNHTHDYAAASHTHNYAGSSSAGGAATSALKLSNTSAIGSANEPVYFNASGVPVKCTYALAKSVPANAVFTDTAVTTTVSTATTYIVGSTASTSATSSLTKCSIYMSANTIHGCSGYYQDSDETLKKFKDDIEVDFEKLRKLPKSYFTWNSDEEKKLQIGTSAQKVQELYPEIVSKGDEGTLSVDYSKLSIIALKAVDQLYEENQKLKSDIEMIKKHLGL